MYKKIRFLNWLSENRIAIMFVTIAIIVELMAVFYVDKSLVITKPWVGLGLLILFTGIIGVIKNNLARWIIGIIGLVVQFLICISFSLVYDMNGQYFTFELLQLRDDAFGILETLPVSFVLFYIPLALMIIFTVFSFKLHFKIKTKSKYRLPITISLIVFGFVMTTTAIVVDNKDNKDKYDRLINEKSQSIYSKYGLSGNFFNEMAKGVFFNKIKNIDDDIVKSYIYYNSENNVFDDNGHTDSELYVHESNDHSGVSSGNNVITILAESLEWFGIRDDYEEYPHNLRLTQTANLDNLENRVKEAFEKEDLDFDVFPENYLSNLYNNATMENIYEYIFPNLYKYFINGDSSIVYNQFHSKEKTDVSESLSIVGAYPTTKYINYNYMRNTVPTTVPNTMRYLYEASNRTFTANAFHNGKEDFYARNKTHTGAFGMDTFQASETLYHVKDASNHQIMTDYIKRGERNLDSEMIKAGIRMGTMFPLKNASDISYVSDLSYKPNTAYQSDSFYTYITSITMHGMYYPRNNLEEYRLLLRTICPEGSTKQFNTSKNLENNVVDYMTTIMEFDKALGVMMDYLEKTGLIHNTTVSLFGDHNAYYSSISNDVKGIKNYNDDCYSDLFHIPFLMYDEKVGALDSGNTVINKFTCTFDIAPTILDLLGVNYFNNMYYGHSAFDSEESIIYSRSYDFFVGKGIHARSLNYILSRGDFVTDLDLENFRNRGIELVSKIKYQDQVYTKDYFSKSTKTDGTIMKSLTDFKEKLKSVNTDLLSLL